MMSKAYNGRDLQMFISMLTQCESDGVTDIRFIRQRLEDDLRQRFGKTRIVVSNAKRTKNVAKCPECGSTKFRPSQDTDGVFYTLCKDCQYSELLGSDK